MLDKIQISKINNYTKALRNFRMVTYMKVSGSVTSAMAMAFKSPEAASDTKGSLNTTSEMVKVHSFTVMAVSTREVGTPTSVTDSAS